MVPQHNRTEGERRFEAYLKAMGYPFEFEKPYPSKSRRRNFAQAEANNPKR